MSPRLSRDVGPDDHSSGVDTAPVTLVEYGDFECPYCGRAYPVIKEIQRELGDTLRFVFRNFPLTQAHPHAEHAAQASEAAAAQNTYWPMHDTLFENQQAFEDSDLIGYAGRIGIDAERFARDLEGEVYAGEVRKDFMSGVRSGVNGTPTFFINGERFDGDWTDMPAFVQALRDAANPVTNPTGAST